LEVLSEPDWQPCVAAVSITCTSVAPAPGGGDLAPTCLASATLSTAKNQPLDLPPAPCSDPRGLPLTITVTQRPTHGTLSDPTAQGNRRYTPARDFVGQDMIRYQASNGTSLSNVALVIINTVSGADPRGASADRTAPTVRWLGRVRLDRHGRARARVRCSEPCLISLHLSAKLRSKRTLTGPIKTATGSPDRPTAVMLTLRRRGRSTPLGRLGRVTVVGSVTDGAGNRRFLRHVVSRQTSPSLD
jgi:hypothetical protein